MSEMDSEMSQPVPDSQRSQATSQSQLGDGLLDAKLDDVQTILSILKTVSFAQEATCLMSSNGLKFIVEQSKSLEAKVFLQCGIFHEFFYADDEQTSFRINLTMLLECLNIFGSSATTTLRMSYAGYGSPLVLMLEDGGVLTDCSIRTMEPEEPLHIDIRSTEIPSNIIMKSQWLADVFAELDMTSELLRIQISPDKPWFRLTTDGNAGTSQVDCPKDSDVIETFTCTQISVNDYNLKLIKPSEKALGLSEKISIRMNSWGVLSTQYLVQTGDGQNVFIEFLCLPEDGQADD